VVSPEEEDQLAPRLQEEEQEEEDHLVAVLVEEEDSVVDLVVVVPMEAGAVVFEEVEVGDLLLLDSNHNQEECQDPDSIMDPVKNTNPERTNHINQRKRSRFQTKPIVCVSIKTHTLRKS
jgi:hypothetical protein